VISHSKNDGVSSYPVELNFISFKRPIFGCFIFILIRFITNANKLMWK